MKFSNQVQSKVTMTDELNNSYNIAGINGTISSADSVIGGLSAILDIVGWQVNDVVRVVNQDVVEGTEPTEPTLALSEFTTVGGAGSFVLSQITYNGDGELSVQCSRAAFIDIGDSWKTLKVTMQNGTVAAFNGTLYASAGTNSLAKSIPFSHS